MITRDEWLAALNEAQQSGATNDPNLLSLYEFAAMVGCHYNSARRRLDLMVSKGLAQRTTKRQVTADGRLRTINAWRLVKAGKKTR